MQWWLWAVLWVVHTAGQYAAVITVNSQTVDTNAGASAMDATCGTNSTALVCTSQRNFTWLLRVPIYSPTALTGAVGRFPYVFNEILLASGAKFNSSSSIYTGCDADGAWLSAASCNNWTSVAAVDSSAVGGAGMNGTSWLNDGTSMPCRANVTIYCIQVIPPVVFVTAGVSPTVNGIALMDSTCRMKDSSYPFTFALVCQSSRDWPTVLAGVPLVDKTTGLSIGPYALISPFNATTAIIDPAFGYRPTTVVTGCSTNFSYLGAATTCNDFTSTGTVAASDNNISWINHGAPTPCLSFSIYCVRSTTLVSLPPFPTSQPTSQPTTTAPTAPTIPTMSPPSFAPTTSFPTLSPTTSFPTTASPTSFPTTASPTTSFPTTSFPTTSFPTTTFPTPSAIAAPTPAPSLVPVVLVLTNSSTGSNTTRTIPGNVTLTLPPVLFLFGNGSAIVQIGRGNLSDFVGPEWVGGDSVVSVVVVVNDQPVQVGNLTVPVDFVIPRSNSACEAQRQAEASCMWWDVASSVWRPDGCLTTPEVLADGSSATRCQCNHLTDFAVLLNRATPCALHQPPSDAYVVFAVIYLLLALYCLIVVVRLQLIRERATFFLRSQHILIGAVALVRMLSCLRFYDLLGESLGLAGVLTALPYLIELWIFTRLASTWLGLVEFTMLASELRWEKIRPLLYGVNIIGSLFTLALFIAFLVELDRTTAFVGTIGIAFVYVFLAVIFLYYSNRLVTTMSSGSKLKRTAESASLSWRGGCSPSSKILFAGRGSACCFAMQALSSVLALVLQEELIATFTILFLLFNCAALLCLLLVYYGAVAKGLRPKVAVPSVSHSDRVTELVVRQSATND